MHCVAYAIFDLLEPYKKLAAFEVIESVLDVYILPAFCVDDALVTKLTGIEIVEPEV